MTINTPPSVPCLVEDKLIDAPRLNAHNQVFKLTHWCHKLRHWVKPATDALLTQRQDYFPALPTASFTLDNNLQSPQQAPLYLGNIKITKQVISLASRKIEQKDSEGAPEAAPISEPVPLPQAEKTFYLAGHIEVATGELVFSHLGFHFPGPLNFSWSCHYRSSLSQDFGLGPGWLHPLCERLWLRPANENQPEAMIHFLCRDGRYIQFAQPAIGEACVNRNENMVLERLGSMNYRLISAGEPERVFRTDGVNPWLPLVEIRDSADNVLSIDYQNGRARKVVSSWGRVVEIIYQAERITQLKSTSANQDNAPLAAYEFTDDGLLARAHDSQARSEQYSYEEGFLKQRLLANGQQFTFNWHPEQQKYLGVSEGDVHHSYKWRAKLRLAEISNNLGHKSSAEFDEANRLVHFTDAEAYHSRWFYDSYGNLCSHTNPLGHTQHYRWDKCGRCIRQTNALGVSTHYKYDPSGNLVQVKNSAGQSWLREYNACGQLVAEQDPLGNIWRYNYNRKFLLQDIEDPEGSKTQLHWNSLAELEQVISQEGKTTRLEYNSAGHLLKVLRADQCLVEYTYDKLNRLESVGLLDGEHWRIKYDDNGRLLAIGDPKGFAAAYEYGEFGYCSAVKYSQGDKTEYRYDASGNCTEVVSSTSSNQLESSPPQSESREYNRLGWLLSSKTSSGRQQSFEYDAVGQLIQHRDMAVIVQIERDAAGKATKITNNSGETCQYHYDELSRLVLAENRWGTLRFQYDLCNKLVAEHQELELNGNHSFLHNYDKRGWHVNTNSDEQHLSYLITPDGLLRGLDVDANPVFRCDFDELGREIQWVHDELKTSVTRQEKGRQSIETKSGTTQATVFNQQFPESTQAILHGILGENLGVQVPEQSRCDERGNLIHEESYTYNYDGWNNLITAESGDFKTYYRYDAFARRIAKVTTHRKSKNLRQTVFCWLGNELWNEIHSTPKGEDCFYYLRHPNHGALLVFLANNKTYYYLNTPSLKPLSILSRRGETLWHARYDESGAFNSLENRSKINSPWRSQNAYYDIETQLYFIAGTYYSPQFGVYLQRVGKEN